MFHACCRMLVRWNQIQLAPELNAFNTHAHAEQPHYQYAAEACLIAPASCCQPAQSLKWKVCFFFSIYLDNTNEAWAERRETVREGREVMNGVEWIWWNEFASVEVFKKKKKKKKQVEAECQRDMTGTNAIMYRLKKLVMLSLIEVFFHSLWGKRSSVSILHWNVHTHANTRRYDVWSLNYTLKTLSE